MNYSLSKIYSESGDSKFTMPSLLAGSQKDSVFILRFENEDPPNRELIKPVRVRAVVKLAQTEEEVVIEQELEIQLD